MMTQEELLEKTKGLALRAQSRLPALANDVVQIPPEDISKLQEDCSKSWTALQKVHADLVKAKASKCAGPEAGSTITIQKAKEKLLQGTIQSYKEKKPVVLPDSIAIQQNICLSDLEKSIAEMYDVLAYIKSQRQEMKEELEKGKRLREQREEIRETLTHRLETLQSEDRGEQPEQSLIIEAENKQEKADIYQRKLMKRLGRFIEEHFPQPAREDIARWAKKRNIRGNMEDVLPMQAIVQELMNKCLDPNDPYVQTDDRYWAPYMQLLVRCGVAQRDPGDDSRFKMTPFHL